MNVLKVKKQWVRRKDLATEETRGVGATDLEINFKDTNEFL